MSVKSSLAYGENSHLYYEVTTNLLFLEINDEMFECCYTEGGSSITTRIDKSIIPQLIIGFQKYLDMVGEEE